LKKIILKNSLIFVLRHSPITVKSTRDYPNMANLRNAYSLSENALKDPGRVKLLNTFFFWASWACVTDRPGKVTGLLLVQVIMGVSTAHFGVEGQSFYGIPLAKILPYAISRSWYVQIAIFWIATSWLATGLYYAPAISGVEPKFQKLGVNFLFGALLVILFLRQEHWP
jgi:nitric oxide reductase large subunit